MTLSLHIGRLRAHYRLPGPSAAALKMKLDGVLRLVLDQALESALEDLGISACEEVCVRAVHAPARLECQGSDERLAKAWSAAIARALREQIASGWGVVRYGSRSHALVDVLTGVADGDLGRAWAWRQLGLWGERTQPSNAGEGATRALAAIPEAAPAALAAVARAGRLERLARRVSAEGWIAVALSALEAAGVDGRVLEGGAGSGGTAQRSLLATVLRERARRVAARAPLAAALEAHRSPKVEGPRARRAVAALAVLVAEPSALQRGGSALVDAVVLALGEQPAEPPRESEDSLTRRSVGDLSGPAGRGGVQESGWRSDASAPHDEGPQALLGAPDREEQREHLQLERTGRREGGHAQRGSTRRPEETWPSAAEGGERPLPAVRKAGRTRAGGLMFLVHIVAELGLPDAFGAEDGPLAARPLSWALHALALALIPIEPRDPAALAFCGLAPDAEPPSGEGGGGVDMDEAEREVLTHACEAVAERLLSRLGRGGEPARAVLIETCRRSAEVLADPAWLEIHYVLDEVDTRVRRAGLDLDPGWLPWLGSVVKFVYA